MLTNVPIFAKDGANLYSAIRGADIAAGIINCSQRLNIGQKKVRYDTVIKQNDDEAICVETQRVDIEATKNGVELKNSLYVYIRYDRAENKLESNIDDGHSFLTREDTRWGDETFTTPEHWMLIIPVAEWLAKNKPYCYKLLQEFNDDYSSNMTPSWIRNIIKMGLFDKADDFEKCYKLNPKVKEYCTHDSLESILELMDVRTIPAQCRDWISTNGDAAAHSKEFSALLSKITASEDGNNAVIFCKYFGRVSKFLDRRSYNYESSVVGFINKLSELIDMGYNSKTVLEYITRQNFYYSRPFGFPGDQLGYLCDYARLAKRIQGEKFERFPSNIVRSHNIIVANNRTLENTDEKTEKMFVDAVSKYAHFEGEINIPKQGKRWVIVAPKKSWDVVNEGVTLNHCVSSYVGLIANGASQILFLRDAKSPETPLYTVEIIGGVITEAKGNYNEELPDDAKEALKEFRKLWKEKGLL